MKKNSLKNKIWFYLSIFTISILIGILFLQLFSLNMYYELSKKTEIKKIANKVSSAYNSDNYNDILDELSFEKDVCIEITEDNNIYYSTDSISRGCLINNSREINNKKLEFMLSNKYSITYKIINSKFNNRTLIYGLKIDDGVYAFISASLQPTNFIVSILKKQLIFILVIVLIISFIVSYTISKKISKPIEKLTDTSKELINGKTDIIFKTDSNIEELKELETTLNNMVDDLSKIEILRSELLANISHDLKTPLTLIKANAEMVKDLTHNNKEKREKNLNTIITEVDRLNLLVEDILDLTKMRSNVSELEKEELNLNVLIKSIIEKFGILCDKEGYKIEYIGFDFNIFADKKKMEQVIYNLINNAINYTGKDKKVYIKMLKIKNGIRVEVIDTGKGIDDKDIRYIWDKYYKVDKKYKRVSYGTGLGLSIVKNILLLHNFNYGVNSKKGSGTKFYFEVKNKKSKK